MPTTSPSTDDEGLDLGEIQPGRLAGHPRPGDGTHPWAPSEFMRREQHGIECDCLDCHPER